MIAAVLAGFAMGLAAVAAWIDHRWRGDGSELTDAQRARLWTMIGFAIWALALSAVATITQ